MPNTGYNVALRPCGPLEPWFNKVVAPAREYIWVMNESNESTVELEQAAFTDIVSDAALEAAAGMKEKFTFTFSIHPFYCRFC